MLMRCYKLLYAWELLCTLSRIHLSHSKVSLSTRSQNLSTISSERLLPSMDFDDSVMLPTQGDDDSFLLSARPIYAAPKRTASSTAEPVETESKRGNGESKLENGRRRTEDLVAKLRRDREERKKREVRDRAVSSPSSRPERGTERMRESRVVDDPEKAEWEDVREVEQQKGQVPQRQSSRVDS